MVEKITKEERKVSLAIEKAKEVIQAFQDGTTVEMEGDLQGEEVKLKKPKKNPAEEKVDNPVGKEEGYGYVSKLEAMRDRNDDDWNDVVGGEQLNFAQADLKDAMDDLEELREKQTNLSPDKLDEYQSYNKKIATLERKVESLADQIAKDADKFLNHLRKK
tara:strand:- start:54 stop:536 length:483 start_codon:yes stop_codon:yes gene_type:complete